MRRFLTPGDVLAAVGATAAVALGVLMAASPVSATPSSSATTAPVQCATPPTVATTDAAVPAPSETAPVDTAPSETAPGDMVTVSASTAPAASAAANDTLQIPLPNATSAPASTSAAATSTPLDQVLVLARDGLGAVRFCDDADTVIATMTALAGPADDDTGWVDPFTISACGGTVARRVTWGSLDLYFGDESRFGSGATHFFGYSYGNIDGFDVAPPGLATPEGVGLGTPVAYLRATYPEVSLVPGEEGIQEPAFYVDENLGGLLTTDTDDGVITLIIGGEACGV